MTISPHTYPYLAAGFFAVGFFYACFQAWNEERDQIEQLLLQINRNERANGHHASQAPDLHGIMAPSIYPAEVGIVLALNVVVWNRGGTSSIVKGWTLHSQYGSHSEAVFDATLDRMSEQDLKDSLMIVEGPTKTGIPPGGEAHYRLVYRLPYYSVSERRNTPLHLALVFYDVMDKASRISETIEI
jgi:hypothetical protein